MLPPCAEFSELRIFNASVNGSRCICVGLNDRPTNKSGRRAAIALRSHALSQISPGRTFPHE
jgi:hypothetical protein